MLFNSYEFIFLFLPITLAVFIVLKALAPTRYCIILLIAASLFYYGWWNPKYLLLLLFSVGFNFFVGGTLGKSTARGRPNKVLLIAGISVNLALLGYYKYTGFLLENIELLFGREWESLSITLPLAISFFTFQQIAYLADSHGGKVLETSFQKYCLFVTFFPQLIAGPIVHHKEMMPQFGAKPNKNQFGNWLAVGITIFICGLFKKLVLADSLATFATPIFQAAERGDPLQFFEAWLGALSYTFQLYFDFSGYSDMAIGLGQMFGIRLPFNFNSPYKATNIIDFWHRWHMTLSRFLRDYLYVPLGGNRKGKTRRYANLMITMLLGGLWHGAGWSFLIWGGLHGFFLVVNHGWSVFKQFFSSNMKSNGYGALIFSRLITFIAVLIGWVIFRAETLSGGWAVIESMVGLQGVSISESLYSQLGILASNEYIRNDGWLNNGYIAISGFNPVLLLIASFVICFLCPNSQELVYGMDVGRQKLVETHNREIRIQATTFRAIVVGFLFAISIIFLQRQSEFLYFQF